ncbi:tRNA lysidine(34) synthetase TilS [Hoeflea sp. IMCC20628]|uniref:tRNA lysidine(34) synthetase TilS n=1 Tax=Hoeflea sp. IMCC20628 TaxID=1620421 RepID=UPI0018CDFDA1|nr:tRNA lysidine(34) synthetase TilS [Hoeflea sp. IMCC20628]
MSDSRPLGVAVSGGSDSLGMLYGLAALLAPVKLVALTVDHGLRTGSADEARQVKSHCRRLGVCHETLFWDDKPPVAGLQAAARTARYNLLGSAAARLGLAAVLTAHTSGDQDETLEMRRARSQSDVAPGLAGIPHATLFDGHMWVLRPLLGVNRAEIRDFLRQANVDWIEDPSNIDERFERVRVRARLKDQPADRRGLGSEDIVVARSLLARRAAAIIDGNCSLETGDTIRMKCSPGEDADVVVAVIEALIDLCGGAGRALDRRGKATLADIASACIGDFDTNGQTITLGRCLIRRHGRELLIRRESRGIEELVLAPGSAGVWDGRYHIRNLDQRAHLHVVGGGPEGITPLFRRDLAVEPLFKDMHEELFGGFSCRRLIGRSSRVLPIHELPLAQALTGLVDTDLLPECPWVNLKVKMTAIGVNVL